ncbi:MalY/PatB family protein [Brucella pituitosa]|nr:MalY/PatB family protein [Brucella pituitosa]
MRKQSALPPVTSALFDEVIDRSASNSAKWSCVGGSPAAMQPLPMSVADCDFRAPQPVLDALSEAVRHGIFGYPTGASQSYLDAVTNWQSRRFGWEVDPDWLLLSAGVVPILKSAVQAFTSPGDTVLIQPPVYPHFSKDVLINGRHLAFAPLQRTETGYGFDAGIFEAAIQRNTKLFILSNPHNPTGTVWSPTVLQAMGEICLRHGILVVSDEIHQDLIMNPALRHTPFASLGEDLAANSITCTAPGKTFNLPGLQCANIIVPNVRLRAELSRQYERNTTPLVNSLGMIACEAAYRHGASWADEMVAYVRANHLHLTSGMQALGEKIRVIPADALYLAWLDCRGLGMDAAELEKFMLTTARVEMINGLAFGEEGRGYMRMNLGCPRSTLDIAIQRIVTTVGRF